ncbi:hypothetical protein BJX70DRAFT_395082 [Aspergillus crustosus]
MTKKSNIHVVISTDQRQPSRTQWAVSIGKIGGKQRDLYCSRRTAAGQYEREIQPNQTEEMEMARFNLGVVLAARVPLKTQERVLINALLEEVAPGPSEHFVLRFLWKLADAGLIVPRHVKTFFPLAHYELMEWVELGKKLTEIDDEFLKARAELGWDLPGDEEEEEPWDRLYGMQVVGV